MQHAASCCGFGDTPHSVYHYDTSKKIGAKKTEAIGRSGATLVATDCSGCIMQLQDGDNHAYGAARVVNLLELLTAALPEAAQ